MKISKNIFVLYFLSVVCFAPFLSAGDLEDANAFYRKGDFKQASVLYRSLAGKNPENPYYHYNLGNCYYKMSEIGKAVASFYRAFDLLPRDGDIRKNLSMALAMSGETLVAGGVPVILHKLYFYFSFAELKGLFWFFLWMWVVFMLLYFAFSSRRNILKPMLIIITGFALCLSLWVTARYSGRVKKLAVVIVPSVSVRSGPADSFNALASIGEGRLLIVSSQKDDWYEVKIKKQTIKGWVKKDLLEVI